ncbi:MAG: UDP-N-acetylmuramoyl-tripeptide--D-alanyl-D-alanine ligase [Anaerolineae bacterium]|jgi:UDP-N-acetylmuramoyl-tripeptide--D-alanyl-D-alanine ligase|nr:UDP-N-acetylmuramoyl-tripeptide--D-alanyl-D-alanine ligase [Anaerolineae bacterium]
MAKRVTLADLIEGMGGRRPMGLEMPFHPILDSREADAMAVFLAFKGEKVDGHDYVADAFARGAVAAVVERDVAVAASVLDLSQKKLPATLKTPLVIRVPNVLESLQRAATFWRQQITNVRVIGITGSVGKTTTKEVVARVLEQRYRVLRSTGSFNNEIGLPLTLLGLTNEYDRVVLEMGMYVRGDIACLACIAQPQVGVVTNVEPVHAERAGSLENIALGKRELVEALPPAPEGVAILNYDDPLVRAMADVTQARVFFYGLLPEAHLWADQVQSLGLEGIRVRLHYGKDQVYLRVPLLGRHSVHTVLRAAAVGLLEGLTWQEIVEGLRAPSAQLRLVSVQGPKDSLILDDTYNSSPPSALAALNLLEDLEGRKIAVLGDMLELGEYEEEGHLKVGGRAAAVVAHLIAVGARASLFAEGARLCGMPPDRIHVVEDNAAAVALIKELLEPRDVVLVKGSHAMQMDTIVDVLSKGE